MAVRTRKVTYLGSRAVVGEVRAAGKDGLRVVITEWIDTAPASYGGFDAGVFTVRVVSGAWETLKQHGETSMAPGNDWESSVRFAARLLTNEMAAGR